MKLHFFQKDVARIVCHLKNVGTPNALNEHLT